MRYQGFRNFVTALSVSTAVWSAANLPAQGQVPVYLPQATQTQTAPALNGPLMSAPNAAASPIADPAPVYPPAAYPPAVPTLPAAAPASVGVPVEAALVPQYPSVTPTPVPQTPIYGPAVPNYAAQQQAAPQYVSVAPTFTAAAQPNVPPTPPVPMAVPSMPHYAPRPGYAAPSNAAPFGSPTAAPPVATTNEFEAFDPPNFSSSGGSSSIAAGSSRFVPSTPMPTLPGYGPDGLDAVCPPNGRFGGGCDPCNVCPPTGCNPCDAAACGCGKWCDNLALFAGYDAFKTPVDLDGLNGNFGYRVGFNAAVPVWAPWGIGVQASGSAAWYDAKGTLYTGDGERFQNFWTLGVFQRSCKTGLGFGIAYDWLYDDYWANMRFGQWRVGASWQINGCNEIGFWGALPDNRDSTTATGTYNQFQSLLQGNFFYRRTWNCGAFSTIYAGLAESPSDITWGTYHQAALNKYMAVYGGMHYVLPGSGDTQGRQEELWNVSVGLLFYPGSAMRVAQSQFRPFFNPADNGSFGIWRK